MSICQKYPWFLRYENPYVRSRRNGKSYVKKFPVFALRLRPMSDQAKSATFVVIFVYISNSFSSRSVSLRKRRPM